MVHQTQPPGENKLEVNEKCIVNLCLMSLMEFDQIQAGFSYGISRNQTTNYSIFRIYFKAM